MQLPYIPGATFCDHCGWICARDGTCLNADCESNVPTEIVPILQLPREQGAVDLASLDILQFGRKRPE